MIDSAAVPQALLPRLRDIGVDIDATLRDAGIAADRFSDGKARLTTAEMIAFWRAVEHNGGTPDIGLRIGAERRDDEYDMASLVALRAANFREALLKLGRYKKLVCPENIELTESDGEARLRFHWLLANEPMPPLFVDGTFATALAIARRGTGKRIVPKRLELSRRRQHEDILKKHFDVDVRFDAHVDVLVFASTTLDEPFKSTDTSVAAKLIPALEEALRKNTLADQVRLALVKRMSGERPSVTRIAHDLSVSSRTLQRKLGDAGTSYQKLLDDVRHGTARRMLSDTDLDVREIAFLLGFEEENSLARAFHTWEGATPRAFRVSHPPSGQRARSAGFARAHSE